MIKAVLFDLDGTLINTNQLIIKTFEITLKHYFPDRTYTDKELMNFIGPTLVQTFTSLWEEKCDEMIDYFEEVNRKLHNQMTEVYPTVKEGLKELDKRKIKLGIVSSKKKPMVMYGLKEFNLDPYFSCIVTADDVKNPKPDKEPIEMAMNILNCRREEVIFVGDNSHDMEGGKNAGVITCGVGWALRGADYLKQFHPDYILEDMRDLLLIIQEVNENGK